VCTGFDDSGDLHHARFVLHIRSEPLRLRRGAAPASAGARAP
jgi:hypothetical protein